MNAKQKETELTDREYMDVLDDIYGNVLVCGMTYSSGRALFELDPTAFRCGKSDYESELDSDNPKYVCESCADEFDDEAEAEECCLSDSAVLVDDGSLDTIVKVNDKEYRFNDVDRSGDDWIDRLKLEAVDLYMEDWKK